MVSSPSPSKCPFSYPDNLFQDLAAAQRQTYLEQSEVFQARIVSKYDDIVHVLDHPEIFSSKVTVPDPPPLVLEKFAGKVPLRGTLLGWDNPDHDRLRKSVSSFFVPRRLARLEPVMRKAAHDLIDGFYAQGSVDIKSAFALPLPLKLISVVAGLDGDRWQWIGRCLALFAGHPEVTSTPLDEQIQGILDIHDYVAELIQLRKNDRRDDLISHIWNERDSGAVEMTDFEHLAMIPGLLLAGHETTTNVLSMGLSHLLHNGLWEKISQSDESRAAAIEELVRFESAITGMRREVTQVVTLRDTELKPGDQLFVAYNSGSRDPQYFTDPDKIDMKRQHKRQHLGFGRGIHACLGAPLARLLLRTELSVIYERLPGLRLITPYEDRKYGHVHEGRGIEKLIIGWDAKTAIARQVSSRASNGVTSARKETGPRLEVIVDSYRPLNESILQITFRAKPGQNLPSWQPGAHIDVPVRKFGYRQYSLCSNPADTNLFQIAVLREELGLGGSKFLHENQEVNKHIFIGGPRNHFPFRHAEQVLFIAGGIGITPVIPMLGVARSLGCDYHLVYLGTSRKRMAFVEELGQDSHVVVWPKDEKGAFSLSSLLPTIRSRTSRVYCCGPSRLLDDVESTFSPVLPATNIHLERFSNKPSTSFRPNQSFDVVMKRSGRSIHVPRDKSLLDVLNENGVGIMSTCSKGTCGTCEIQVLEGTPEHRDTVLSTEERMEGKSMMSCVSRCLGERLILDLW